MSNKNVSFTDVFKDWISLKDLKDLEPWEEVRKNAITKLLINCTFSAIPGSEEESFVQDRVDETYLGFRYEDLRTGETIIEQKMDPKIWVLLEHPGSSGHWIEEMLVQEALDVLSTVYCKREVKIKDVFSDALSEIKLIPPENGRIEDENWKAQKEELTKALNAKFDCIRIVQEEDTTKTLKLLELKKKTWSGGTGGRGPSYGKVKELIRLLSNHTNFIRICKNQKISAIEYRHGVLYDPKGDIGNENSDTYGVREETRVLTEIKTILSNFMKEKPNEDVKISFKLFLEKSSNSSGVKISTREGLYKYKFRKLWQKSEQNSTWELEITSQTIYYDEIFEWFLEPKSETLEDCLAKAMKIEDILQVIELINEQRAKAIKSSLNDNDFTKILFLIKTIQPHLVEIIKSYSYERMIESFAKVIKNIGEQMNRNSKFMEHKFETDLTKIMKILVLLGLSTEDKKSVLYTNTSRSRVKYFYVLRDAEEVRPIEEFINNLELDDYYKTLEQMAKETTAKDPFFTNIPQKRISGGWG